MAKKKQNVKEIRYTCLSCDNLWHKLASSESTGAKVGTGTMAGLSCIAAPCCSPLYLAAAASTAQDKQCPKCHSKNIKREVMEYDSNGNPV